MEIILKAAFERDVDFVLVRAFSQSSPIVQLFLNDTDRILEVHHSAIELHGESDLLIIVERGKNRHAILIEDKIDAQAQPNQYQRYCQRGENGKAAGRWTDYTVCIAAPQKYLEGDSEAQKYPHKVSYEAIRDKLALLDDSVSLAIIETALAKAAGTLPQIVDEAVTEFWEHYYDYHLRHAPHLQLHINRCKKGPNATWPEFKTALKDTKILHKSEQGNVDLQFRAMAESISLLQQMIQPYLEADMQIRKAGESAVVRITVPIMDFSKPFAQHKNDMPIIYDAVARLTLLAEKLSSHKL